MVRNTARELKVEIVAEYIPGNENPADGPSRAKRDEEDFKIRQKWLKQAVKRFNTPHPATDLFANRHNASRTLHSLAILCSTV